MAWQLIYTSAPRLLEAGRTGFGTVARHRSVGGLLTSAVERLSQFARLPGHDPKRVVFSHRIISVGNSEYHVLSRLRDAGSDYTGRTNHIAHHLIAEGDEVRGLAELGITPADVLLAMPWRESWSEGARFLEAAEEIDLGGLKARPSKAWEQLTGDRRSAALLCSAAARKGCYVVTPDNAPVLELLRESLNEMADDAWEMTFTTSLEPNDDVADFRWIALPGSSPLRAQTEGTSRQIFDLQNAASLPPLPEAPSAPAAPRQSVPSTGRESLPPPAMGSPGGGAALPRPDLSSPMVPMVPGGLPGRSPVRRGKRAKRSLLPFVLVGVVLLLACASAVVWFQVIAKQQQQESESLVQAIEATWKKHQLQLDQTKAALVAKANDPEKSERDKVRPLLARYEAEFGKIERIIASPQIKLDIDLPEVENRDDFSELSDALQGWAAAASVEPLLKLWTSVPAPAPMAKALGDWLTERSKAWKKCAVHFAGTRPASHDEDGMNSLLARVREMLKGESRPDGLPQEWQELFLKLGEGLGAPAQAPTWVAEWARLHGLGAGDHESAKKVCEAVEALKDAPAWLKTEAHKRRKEAEAAIAAAAEKNKPAAPPPEIKAKVKIEDVANAFEAEHPIYFCFLKGDEGSVTFDVPVLTDYPTPEMHFGGFAALDQWPFFEDSYRLKKMVLDAEQIKVKGAALTVPVRPGGGWLVACTKEKKVLFDVRVITSAALATELLKFSTMPEYKVSAGADGAQIIALGGFLKRLHFIRRTASSIFHLVSTEGKSQHFELLPAGGDQLGIALHMPVTSTALRDVQRKKLEQDIANLKASIQSDEKDIKVEEASKFTDKEKKVAKLKAAKAKHEDELAAKQAALAAIEGPSAAPRVRISPGKYFLQARFASNEVPSAQDLCLLKINVPSSPP